MNYNDFLKTKKIVDLGSGFEPGDLNENMFLFQGDVTRWACRRGRAAIFEGTGLGKTLQQLSWGDAVTKETKAPVLILAPLAVSKADC